MQRDSARYWSPRRWRLGVAGTQCLGAVPVSLVGQVSHTLVAVTGGPRDAAAGAIGSHTAGGIEEVEGLPEGEEAMVPVMPGLGSFVISITGSTKHKRLHLVGACYRIPGVHYLDFTVLGTEVPDASEYHVACKQCFKGGVTSQSSQAPKSSDSEAESISSSSDSGSGDG